MDRSGNLAEKVTSLHGFSVPSVSGDRALWASYLQCP